MNVKQTLILLGGAAVVGLFAYLTLSGQGVQSDEYVRVGIAGGLLVASIGGLAWAFGD
jgi:hypothetical protein